MTIPLATPLAKLGLADLLDIIEKDVFINLNCHALATVDSFNSETQTVQATINYCQTYQQIDPTSGQIIPEENPYPNLLTAPVVSLCGGSTYLSMPIAKGDQCIILFNDRDMSNWYQGARDGFPATNRLHAFADAIAIVGLNDISGYDAVRALLTNGTVKLGINPSTNKITMKNGSTSLYSILNTFFTACSTATTAAQIATAAANSITPTAELLES